MSFVSTNTSTRTFLYSPPCQDSFTLPKPYPPNIRIPFSLSFLAFPNSPSSLSFNFIPSKLNPINIQLLTISFPFPILLTYFILPVQAPVSLLISTRPSAHQLVSLPSSSYYSITPACGPQSKGPTHYLHVTLRFLLPF